MIMHTNEKSNFKIKWLMFEDMKRLIPLTWALHFTYVQNNHTVFPKYGKIVHQFLMDKGKESNDCLKYIEKRRASTKRGWLDASTKHLHTSLKPHVSENN